MQNCKMLRSIHLRGGPPYFTLEVQARIAMINPYLRIDSHGMIDVCTILLNHLYKYIIIVSSETTLHLLLI